jgi:hypothetical protein
MTSKIGRAPTNGSFKKGDDPRRNKNGQLNKPAVQFTHALRDLIVTEGNKKHTITDPNTGEQVTLTKIEWVVIAAYNAAVTGDSRAREWISERTEGKVSQPLSIDSMTEEQRFEYVRGLLARSGFVLEQSEEEGLEGQASDGEADMAAAPTDAASQAS